MSSLLGVWAMALALLLLGGRMLKRLSVSGEPVRRSARQCVDYENGWARRRSLLRRNPIYWMVSRASTRQLVTFLLFSFLIAAWFGFLYVFEDKEWCVPAGFFVFGPLIHLLFKIVVISEASELFASTRRGELELLLVSPLSSSKIILGHWRALLRQLAWPAGLLLAADLCVVFLHRSPQPRPGPESTIGYLFVFALGMTLLVDLPALIWRGLWNGLRCSNALAAMRRTILEVLVVPLPFFLGAVAVPAWLGAIFIAPLLEAFGIHHLDDGAGTVSAMIVLWWLVSFLAGFLLERNARHNLSSWLRYIAAHGGGGARLRRRRIAVHPRLLSPLQAERLA